MPVSDKRQPLGGQLLPKTARRQAKKIQRLRRNKGAVRNQTRRDDRASQSRDRGRESKTKRGRRLRRPQNLVCSKQREVYFTITFSFGLQIGLTQSMTVNGSISYSQAII